MATHSSIPAWTIPFLAPAHAFKCLASQVVPMVKNPPASPGDKRCGFSLWVGTIPWSRKRQPLENYMNRGGAWQATRGYKRVMATFFVFNFFMENFKHIQKQKSAFSCTHHQTTHHFIFLAHSPSENNHKTYFSIPFSKRGSGSHSVAPDSFETPWMVASQAPLSMGSPRQKYWSGLPFPSPGDISNLGIEPWAPALQADALPSEAPGKPLSPHIVLP